MCATSDLYNVLASVSRSTQVSQPVSQSVSQPSLFMAWCVEADLAMQPELASTLCADTCPKFAGFAPNKG